MWRVQLFKLNFDGRETSAVLEVLESGWLTMGEKTLEFENQFATFLDNEVSATAVASGTAALHMAMLASGVGAGDEVIIPALTFVADINVVAIVGARPVLADCTSLSNWNVSPVDIEKKVTPRTKAVVVVHYGGFPCDMEAIQRICTTHDLRLIEDCAHSPGARYRGKYTGTFGDIGCFSFFSNKNISIGEGGMATTSSPEFERRLRSLRSHGMSTLTLDRHQGRATSYDVAEPGLNYRMDEIRAALGLVQLSKLNEANEKRKKIFQYYVRALKDAECLVIPFLDAEDVESSYHIFTVLLPEDCNRMVVMEALKSKGIQSSIHYPAFHGFSAYTHVNLDQTPIASEISRRALTLPLYPTMTVQEVELVIQGFKHAVDAASK